MAIRELRYDGDPILRKQCREVENIDGRIRQILDDMMDTLHTRKTAQHWRQTKWGS